MAKRHHTLQKKSCSTSSAVFSIKFIKDVTKLKEHSNRYRAQFSRIRQIKELVADPINKSKLLRIDWSENAELYQTQQEKSVYYTQISSSINTGVLYSPDGVLSLSTISDCLDHKALATWALLSQMLKSIDMTNTDIYSI